MSNDNQANTDLIKIHNHVKGKVLLYKIYYFIHIKSKRNVCCKTGYLKYLLKCIRMSNYFVHFLNVQNSPK